MWIQTLSPTTGEVFYLCCLLGRRAAYDFDELCAINGVVYETYHEATLELGLFSNDNERFFALKEAVMSYQTPGQL